MASGWGEEDGLQWYAARNFAFKNLTVAKGGRLPNAWQHPANVKYLKEHYGETCVVRKAAKETLKDGEEDWVPSRKGTKQEMAKAGKEK